MHILNKLIKNYKDTAVIFSAYGLFPMLEYELEIVQGLINKEYKVIFITCYGARKFCSANMNGLNGPKKRLCVECKSRVKKGIKWIARSGDQLNVEDYENYLTPDDLCEILNISENFEKIKTLDDVHTKNYNIKGIDILAPAISVSLTYFKVMRLKNTVEHLSFLKEQLKDALRSVYISKRIVEKHSPKIIYIFNGRTPLYNPILEYAKIINLKAMVYEYPLYGFEKYNLVENNYSHDHIAYSNKLLSFYYSDKNNLNFKNFEGENFYKTRFSGVLDGFSKDYLKHQIPNYFPYSKSGNKFRITIFTTSQYELVQVKELKKYRFYESQIDVMNGLVDKFSFDCEIFIRVHPNSFEDREFMSELMKFDSEEVKVIPPDSSLDTYQLIQYSDLVVTFGSTVGAESAYIGKPVILLGPATYFHFNLALFVGSYSVLYSSINKALHNDFSDFPSLKDRVAGAIKYAYAHMNFGQKSNYLVRKSFYGGHMLRDGKKTKISPNLIIYFYNRIVNYAERVLRTS